LAGLALKSADAVVVLGEDMKEIAIGQGASPDHVHVIRNWADPDRIFPVPPEKNRLRREWGLEGKFVVAYSGNFGVSHDFDDLLSVAEELASDDRFRFLFIGQGIRRPQAERFVSSRKLRNVILRPYQEASILPESLSAGDVHFISLREGFEGLVVPSKAYGVMAAGRPVIYQGSESGEIARMVSKERIGFVVSPGDRERLKRRILEMRADAGLRKRMGETARRALVERYSASIGLDLYRKLLAGEL
jgi:glycosyltransferase involved in cell wall biosynthesis